MLHGRYSLNRITNKIKMLTRRSLNFDYYELICSIGQLINFIPNASNSKSVLIVELNPYHGEVLLGYAKYFHELDYDITLIVRRRHIKDGIFAKIDCNKYHQIIPLSPLVTSLFFSRKQLLKFDTVFFTSERYTEEDGIFEHVFKYLRWPHSSL